MSTPPAAAPIAARRPAPEHKFSLKKTQHGGITLFVMQGTLNESFEGKKIAEAVRSEKLIVNMREVSRFASWGMSEWMDFLRVNSDRDVYLVECSAYAVTQLNLVTGLLGDAKLVSYYASFLCGSCGEESDSLLLIPRDREAIRQTSGSFHDCTTCGGRARSEAFLETIANRPLFDIDDEVLAFMRSRLNYELSADLTRFRARRRVHKAYTYLRLSGSTVALPGDALASASEGTTVVDLEGIVFDSAQPTAWRTYAKAAQTKVTSLQLLNCPTGFLEHAVQREDLHGKLKVRTFALSYDCVKCNTTQSRMIDVAENLEQLVGGMTPSALCPGCKSTLTATVSPNLLMLLRTLPARDRDAALETFVAKARAEDPQKLEDCLVARPSKLPAAPQAGGRTMYVAVGLSVLVIAGLGLVGVGLWKQRRGADPGTVTNNGTTQAVNPPAKLAFARPEWIVSDVPSSGYCHDMINRLMCVGVSAYRPTRDEAVAEATDAALEELVSTIGLKISDPFIRDTVVPAYSQVRAKALSALQAADLDRTSAGNAPAAKAYAAADGVVRNARKRVVEILQASGGAAVPTQRSDWFWEEYDAANSSKGKESLVFVRYDVSLDAVRALVEKYSAPVSVMGTSAVTAFPALAWQHPDFTGGAVLTKVDKPLTGAGISARNVVMAVGAQRVTDATGFARQLEEALQAPGELQLTVSTGPGPGKVINVLR